MAYCFLKCAQVFSWGERGGLEALTRRMARWVFTEKYTQPLRSSNFKKSSWVLPITLYSYDSFSIRATTYVGSLDGEKIFYWFKQKHISTIFTQLSSGISATCHFHFEFLELQTCEEVAIGNLAIPADLTTLLFWLSTFMIHNRSS